MSVALRSGDNATLETWMRKKKATMPTVNDASGELAREGDVKVTPTLVVISHGEVKSIPPAGPTAGNAPAAVAGVVALLPASQLQEATGDLGGFVAQPDNGLGDLLRAATLHR